MASPASFHRSAISGCSHRPRISSGVTPSRRLARFSKAQVQLAAAQVRADNGIRQVPGTVAGRFGFGMAVLSALHARRLARRRRYWRKLDHVVMHQSVRDVGEAGALKAEVLAAGSAAPNDNDKVQKLPEYLSPSSIALFRNCPRKFEYRYILKVPEEPSFAMTRGSLVHDVLENLFELPAEERSLSRAMDLAVSIFCSYEYHYLGLFTGDGAAFPTLKEQNTLFKEANQCLRKYFDLEDPMNQDHLSTESWLKMDFEGVDESERLRGIRGRMDRLDLQDDADSSFCATVVDYKTASQRDGVNRVVDPDWMQMQLYALMLRQGTFNDLPVKMQGKLIYLGFNTGVREVEVTSDTLKEAEVEVHKIRNEILEAARKPDGFAHNMSTNCSYCDFRAECKEANSTKLVKNDRVTIVRTRDEADKVLNILNQLVDNYHAIDTETDGWEPGVSPYACGRVICFSVFCGPDVDFGNGPQLWVDNLDDDGNETDMVGYFRAYLENAQIKKVFHNYSFDRAMFINMGIDVDGFAVDTMHLARLWDSDNEPGFSLKALTCQLLGKEWQKTDSYSEVMDGLFGAEAQLGDKRDKFIEYSALDAVATWGLHSKLSEVLEERPLEMMATKLGDDPPASSTSTSATNMLDFYDVYWKPFAEVLVRIEQKGIYFDADRVKGQLQQASDDISRSRDDLVKRLQDMYLERWPEEKTLAEDIRKININSRLQLGQLLFGRNEGDEDEAGDGAYDEREFQISRTKADGGNYSVKIRSLDMSKDGVEFTPTGQPQVNDALFSKMATRPEFEDLGKLLSDVRALEKLITFMNKYLELLDKDSRIRSSFNIGTGTGRLTSSNPNLQQVPGYGKDKYGLRKCFCAPPGKMLIVADYAQLELRVLAQLSGCAPMIDALANNGDLHSRTAAKMFSHIQEAVNKREVDIEGDGTGDLPLVKDVYAAERRQAKAVTFGLVYGITKYGLSKDLGTTPEEAQIVIDRWYEANPEVKLWQQKIELFSGESTPTHTCTWRGRWRQIHGWNTSSWSREAAIRQVKNAPVQGTAADMVIEAMIKISRDEELRKLGYEMVLQVHDELVLEGPEEVAQRAMERVKEVMEHPFLDGKEFNVPLTTDVCMAKTWGDA